MLPNRFIHDYKVKQVLAPTTAKTADTASKAVDRSGSADATNMVGGLGSTEINFVFNVGNAGDTWSSTDRIGLRLQESADSTDGNDGTWTEVDIKDIVYDRRLTVTGNQVYLTSSSLSDLSAYALGYIGSGKMVRASMDFNGTHSSGTQVDIVAVLGVGKGPAQSDDNAA